MEKRKNTKLHIPISSEDKGILKKRAEESGLSLCSYCLFVLKKAVPKVEYSEE